MTIPSCPIRVATEGVSALGSVAGPFRAVGEIILTHGHNVAVYFITKRKIASDGHQYVNASGRANARPNNSNNTVPKCQSLPGGSTGMFIVPRWGIVVKFIQNRKHLETCQLEAEQVMAGILTF